MSDIKPPMSVAYKVVFVFAILMMLLALLGGSKSGIGTLLWGYTAWLMFKRNNVMLVTTFKALLWFEVAVGGVGLIVLAINSDDISMILVFGALILLAIAISYGMVKFFSAQIKAIESVTSVSSLNSKSQVENEIQPNIDSDKLWEEALSEFNSSQRNTGLWAKCFANNGGDENRAKAEYLKESVARFRLAQINSGKVSVGEAGKLGSEVKNFSSSIAMTKDEIKSEFSDVLKNAHASNTSKYFVITFGLVILVALSSLFFLNSYDNKKKEPIFSGDKKSSYEERRSYTISKINDGSLIAYPSTIELFNDVTKIYYLPWVKKSRSLSVSQIDSMEDNNLWWIEKNTIYVRLYNPVDTPLNKAILSLKRGKCDTQGEKVFLLLNLNESLPANEVKIYKAELPFSYKKYYGGTLNCADIDGAYATY